MKRKSMIVIGSLAVVMALAGCRKQEAPVEEPVRAAEQAAENREVARQREATDALRQRLMELGENVSELRGKVASRALGVPRSLERSLGDLNARREEPDRLLAELDQASGGAWEESQAALDAALGRLRDAYDQTSAELAEWERREQATLEAHAVIKLSIDEKTGLIKGLDGGEYPRYHVFRIEWVQRCLREEGLYAGPVDGYLDETTMEAVGAFQEQQALHRSGVLSPMTRSGLYAVCP